MATTYSASKADWIKPHRGNHRIVHWKEDASQTFKKGDPLKFASTASHQDRVLVVGADPTAYMGVAAQDASGTTDKDVAVWIAEPQAEFMGCVQDTGVTTLADIGVAYGIVYDSSNTIWRVDRSETTTTVVVVTGLIDDPGTTNGRVTFYFKSGTGRVPFNG